MEVRSDAGHSPGRQKNKPLAFRLLFLARFWKLDAACVRLLKLLPHRSPQGWTCAQDMWVAATLHPDLVARHGIEPYPLAFQTSTPPSSSRAKLWWTVRDLNSHFTVAGRG